MFLGLAASGMAAATLSGPVRAAPVKTSARVVIIGAGAGGTALVNRLIGRLDGASITIIDPSEKHLYQPGLSLVAAGLKPASYTESKTTDWLPGGITYINEAAAGIDPETRRVTTSGGQAIDYDFLVVAPGLVLDHDAIEGFSLDLVGSNGIGALYAGPEYAARTWQAASKYVEQGGRRHFHPPGDRDEMRRRAAQAHLPDRRHRPHRRQCGQDRDHLRRQQPEPLRRSHRVGKGADAVREPRDITPAYSHPARHRAWQPARHLHRPRRRHRAGIRLPPRHPAAARARRDPAVGPAWADRWTDQGWVEVDQEDAAPLRYPEIFALGDVAGVPKGKTAASVKWQVPVVEDHLVAAIAGTEGTATYNGYTSCPLITRVGRAMLIEFDYNNDLTPSFPGIIAPLEELWISWLMKEVALKATYNAMLRGKA
jgi:sulfide:quinone oxidoreductase